LEPFVTWGTNPGLGLPLNASVPNPAEITDAEERGAAERALTYMADGKRALALKEVEKIMAENPNDEGVKLILSALETDTKTDSEVTQEVESEEVTTSDTELPDADWYADPLGADEFRFWNGTEWTEYVSNAGVVAEKPL
jgi:hypothetical protein